MARKTKEERFADIHANAMSEFDTIQEAMRDVRMQCLKDRRFYSISGAQWEGDLGAQFENKPKFEVNKIHLSVIRIINEYRNNRITVDFVSKEGDEYDQLADTLDGLYRASEEASSADEAYDNAFEEAVGGGFGAWRLRTDYEDEEDDEDERQCIKIEPIYDADSSVFFDLNAKRQDKSDARYCYVLTSMTPQAYEEMYDDDPTSWPKTIQQTEFDWVTPDVVYVAEYYKVEEKRETVHIYETLAGEEERYTDADFEQDDELEAVLDASGTVKVREKKVMRKKVHKYIMSAKGILEDCGFIAGSCIPVVPVYGKRWFVDNVERCMGHVRLAKDVQRLKNMQLSKLGEISALSSVEKPIMTAEQIAGYEMMWAEDNLKDYPYLLVNPITDANGAEVASGPVGYTKPASIPPAMAALLQITEQDMQDILGKQEAGEQLMSNISGKAIELVQQKLDMQAYIYMSNMAKAIKRSGEIWLGMAKEVFVEAGRKMKTLNPEYEVGSIELNTPYLDTETGETKYKNDIASAKYDIAVEVGPSSQSKREATVRAITGMMQVTQDPETMNVLSSMAIMNMEGEGISDIRGYFRDKLIKMGVITPTEEEMQELQAQMQNAQPDANQVYLQSAAQNEMAKAKKAEADTLLALAKAEETKAKTMETMSGIKSEGQNRMIKAAEMIQQSAQELQPQSNVQQMSNEELMNIARGG